MSAADVHYFWISAADYLLPQIQLERARDELTLQNFTLKSRLSQVANNIHDPAATYQITNKDGPLSGKGVEPRKELSPEGSVDAPDVTRKNTYKVTEENLKIKALCKEHDTKELQYKDRLQKLELELKNLENKDKSIRDLEEMLERAEQKREVTERFLEEKEEELNMLKLDVDTLTEENTRLKESLNEVLQQRQVRLR